MSGTRNKNAANLAILREWLGTGKHLTLCRGETMFRILTINEDGTCTMRAYYDLKPQASNLTDSEIVSLTSLCKGWEVKRPRMKSPYDSTMQEEL